MATIESMYEISLCGNCVVWHFNRDDSGMESDEPRPMKYWDEDEALGDYAVELIMDQDNDEPVQHFSHSDCEGCGAIAGTRYDARIHVWAVA